MLFEFVCGTRGGIEAKGRSAAQYDGMHLLNGVLRFEQVRFTRCRRRPAYVDAADGSVGRDDCSASRSARTVREVPELESGNLGD